MPSKFLGYSGPKPQLKAPPMKIKAVKVGNSLRMTIPQEFCSALEIEAGDVLLVSISNNQLEVKKA